MADHGRGQCSVNSYYTQQGPRQETRARGLRSVYLRRVGNNGFGFTLRHFILYPPETYMVLQDEPGAEEFLDVPLDTMFVQNLHEDAEAAGLRLGDRIVAVNGQSITRYSYAEVVQLIKNSGNYLQLLVVSKDQDLLQRHFPNVAHNPETNFRPRMKQPETSRNLSLYGMQKPCTSQSDTNFKNNGRSAEIGDSSSFTYDKENCRFMMSEDLNRRDSSISLPCSSSVQNSKDSLSSESTSMLTGCQEGYSSEDSLILSRIRKSFEQKEEFLRRPNQPIVWDPSSEYIPHHEQAVIAREFYARPQKFQRPLWPPQNYACQSSIDVLPYRHQSPGRSLVVNGKPQHENVCRVKSELTIERDFPPHTSNEEIPFERASSEPRENEDTVRRSQFMCGGPESHIQVSSPNYRFDQSSAQFHPNPVKSVSNKTPFVTTLSRIHENVPSVDSAANQMSSNHISGDHYSSANNSIESPSLSPRETSDRYTDHPKLHLVSRRARQFETGQPEEDEYGISLGDRTSLYRSELARLSSKKVVPDVATRKQEFESRSAVAASRDLKRVSRESRSLESAEPPHCSEDLNFHSKIRTRSNSAESWNAARTPRSVSEWNRINVEDISRHKAVRQDSYLAAVSSPFVSGANKIPAGHSVPEVVPEYEDSLQNEETKDSVDEQRPAQHSPAVRPNVLPIPNLSRPNIIVTDEVDPMKVPHDALPGDDVVLRRREGSADLTEEERLVRRVSYLKATWGDRIHVDSDLDISDTESNRQQGVSSLRPDSNKENQQSRREGWLHCKFTLLDGKRAGDRSWKQVWAVLRGSVLHLYRDRRDSQNLQSPPGSAEDHATFDVRDSRVDVAGDYTKRKNVLRLTTTSCSELLLQAEDTLDMAQWIGALQSRANSNTSEECSVSSADEGSRASASGVSRLSPLPAHKGIKKLTSFRTRSPTGQSPVNKTRKPSQTDQLPSPKSKTWKGRVAKQFRRIQGSGSPSSPTQPYPEGATIGIPLEECPMSASYESVPLLVHLCTSIVEERGLDIIGIYRVPGNTAAVSSLTEGINKGIDCVNLQDPRWSDVNVISSLLKLFFRRLPDSLFTSELYSSFIDADKVEDPVHRIIAIKKLIHDLPEHHYETLKFLLFHLKKVVAHCEKNKMEARNLAIVFGPTLVRAGDDNMVTMVTDMSHQCRIIESLITHVDWFFTEEESEECLSPGVPEEVGEPEPATANHDLLLSNIMKVEGMKAESPSKDISAKDIVSSIISAANRKMQKAKTKKSLVPSHTAVLEDSKDSMTNSSKDWKQAKDLQTPANIPAANERSAPVATLSEIESDVTLYDDDLQQPDCSSNTQQPGTKKDNSDLASWTYAGLSATTQERIRRFERETKAMLRQDPGKQRRDPDNVKVQESSAEEYVQPVSQLGDEVVRRRELRTSETGDQRPSSCLPLTTNSDVLTMDGDKSNQEKSARSAFISQALHSLRTPGLRNSLPGMTSSVREAHSPSISVSDAVKTASSPVPATHPTSPNTYSSQIHLNGLSAGSSPSEVSKKLKTNDKQVDSSRGKPMSVLHCGSLDSLQEAFSDRPHSDISDDGSDLLASLTTTFDQKLKSLLAPSSGILEDSRPADESPHPEPVDIYRDPSLHRGRSPTRDTLKLDTSENVRRKTDHASRSRERKYKDPHSTFQKRLSTEEQKGDVKESTKDNIIQKTDNSNCVQVTCEQPLSRCETDAVSASSSSSNTSKHCDSPNKVDKYDIGKNTKLKYVDSCSISDKSETSFSKPKRYEYLTKDEKTESNIGKRKQELLLLYETRNKINIKDKENIAAYLIKLKRKNGMPERSIKRRHTVGGTKDFDKLNWLDNRVQQQQLNDKLGKENRTLRTSSPDLSCTRLLRPHSLPDPNLVSRVFKIPLESHV